MALLNKGKTEEELKIQEKWFDVRRVVKTRFDKRPDINAILFLIGINELGFIKEVWEKEEKQDLMHVALCTLFKAEGYYAFDYKDEDGWPHFNAVKAMPNMLLKEQENTLKSKIIDYFLDKGYID